MQFIKRIDVHVFAVFMVVSSLTYLFGYHFILEHDSQPYLARLHTIVIVYGSAQSFFGFVAGYCFAKCWYGQQPPPPRLPAECDALLSEL